MKPPFEFVVEQADGREDVGEAHLQIALAGLEDGSLPMRMRNQPEDRFFCGNGRWEFDIRHGKGRGEGQHHDCDDGEQ